MIYAMVRVSRTMANCTFQILLVDLPAKLTQSETLPGLFIPAFVYRM